MVTKLSAVMGIGVVGALSMGGALAQTPVASAFTYQGQLRQGGALVDELADFQFSLWDAFTGGNQIGSTQLVANVEVFNGLFTVWLDFGSGAFAGEARFLEILVRVPAGSGDYTLLTPRQEVGAVPYALYALEASGGSSDADTVDSFHASATPTANTLLPLNGSAKLPLSVLSMGAGSGLDADLLDSQHGAFYRDASNLNAGTVASARLSGTYSNVLTLPNPANLLAGDGAGLTNLNASNLMIGSVPDVRLSPNVALLDNAQIVSGVKTFTAAPSFTAVGAPFAVNSPTLVANLNADKLDGSDGAFFQNASNLNVGTLSDSRLSGTYSAALTFSNAANNFTGHGTGLTSLDAGNIATGSLNDGRLSPNVALLNNPQTFSATKTFSAAPSFAAAGQPFTVTSSTAVANLNADLLDGQHGAYYRNASNINGGTLSDMYLTTNVALLNTPQTFSTDKYFGGKVGIGTTIPAYPLQVETSLARAISAVNSGASGNTYAVYGESSGTGGLGVYGRATATSGTTYGVYGRADSTNGRGVCGYAATASGSNNYGVYGQADSPSGTAVCGVATSATGSPFAICGQASGSGYAGYFSGRSYFGGNVGIGTSSPAYSLDVETSTERAIYGYNTASSGTTYGLFGRADSSAGWAGYFQGRGYFTDNVGIGGGPENSENWNRVLDLYGTDHAKFSLRTNTNSIDARVMAHSSGFWSAPAGMVIGTKSYHPVSFGTYAATRMTIMPSGRVGFGTTNPSEPVHITSSSGGNAVLLSVSTSNTDTAAVYGQATNTLDYGFGVEGVGNYRGVHGLVDSGSSTTSWDHRGVWGKTNGGSTVNYGVYGEAWGGSTAYGVYGTAGSAATNYAGYFSGNVSVTGTLSKGGGSFKIDHPLDPENKYLYHSFVESPDMMNVYNGNITTDADGIATVTLPEWFEALNRDFRYQLTVIGQFAQAIVAAEIKDNQFAIRTDKPNVKVSWQVTGIRQDPFANANRIPVEEEKPADERGKFLYPAAYDLPNELGIDFSHQQIEAQSKLNAATPEASDQPALDVRSE